MPKGVFNRARKRPGPGLGRPQPAFQGIAFDYSKTLPGLCYRNMPHGIEGINHSIFLFEEHYGKNIIDIFIFI